MATRQLTDFTTRGTHAVGNLSNLKIKTVAHGAIVDTADIDNFTVVELSFNANGERIAKQLSDSTKKGYLIASPEIRYMGEEINDFYNAVGEHARIVIFEPGYTRFESSAFDATGVSDTVANGQVAYFDTTAKKFKILPANTADATYTAAKLKLLVVSSEDDIEYTLGFPTVRFEVVEA
jgi:hypothetical protein